MSNYVKQAELENNLKKILSENKSLMTINCQIKEKLHIEVEKIEEIKNLSLYKISELESLNKKLKQEQSYNELQIKNLQNSINEKQNKIEDIMERIKYEKHQSSQLKKNNEVKIPIMRKKLTFDFTLKENNYLNSNFISNFGKTEKKENDTERDNITKKISSRLNCGER